MIFGVNGKQKDSPDLFIIEIQRLRGNIDTERRFLCREPDIMRKGKGTIDARSDVFSFDNALIGALFDNAFFYQVISHESDDFIAIIAI